MATAMTAHLTPQVLRWARKANGYTEAEVAHEIDVYTWQIEQAEAGQVDLDYGKAEKLAELYELPLATLFLPSPPVEESPEALFRRLPGAPRPPWPPAMNKLVRRVRERQEAAVELYDLLAKGPPWIKTVTVIDARAPDLSLRLRDLLGISVAEQQSWEDTRGHTALRAWVDAVESLGVLVMQDGSMAVDEMRGFASLHESVPAIILNSKDDPRARAFTVIHELGHIIRPKASEVWCNQLAGEVLMPTREFCEEFHSSTATPERKVSDLARSFSVTPSAAAVRVSNARLLPRDKASALVALTRSRQRGPRPSGGDFYRNKITWLGPAFVRLVLNAADENAVTLSNAAGLLEAKVDQFAGLRRRLEERAQLR